MNDEVFGRSSAAPKVTWVVICTPDQGKPYPEYVEGTRLMNDRDSGTVTILDGAHVVRTYCRGAWSNFAEWVSYAYGGTVIRRADSELSAPANRWSPGEVFRPADVFRGADIFGNSSLPTPREG